MLTVYIAGSLLCWAVYVREAAKDGVRVVGKTALRALIPPVQVICLVGAVSLIYIRRADKEDREDILGMVAEHRKRAGRWKRGK